MTSATFAARVQSAAQATPPAGRFHDKAYVHAVWAVGNFGHLGLSLEAFKSELWHAHRAGLVELSRADMVEAMNPYDVRRSRLDVMGSTFNFVRIN
jgi:hypothetical protein